MSKVISTDHQREAIFNFPYLAPGFEYMGDTCCYGMLVAGNQHTHQTEYGSCAAVIYYAGPWPTDMRMCMSLIAGESWDVRYEKT